MGDLFGDSFDMLYELTDDIWAMGGVQGSAE
jgi:hypothetical protein